MTRVGVSTEPRKLQGPRDRKTVCEFRGPGRAGGGGLRVVKRYCCCLLALGFHHSASHCLVLTKQLIGVRRASCVANVARGLSISAVEVVGYFGMRGPKTRGLFGGRISTSGPPTWRPALLDGLDEPVFITQLAFSEALLTPTSASCVWAPQPHDNDDAGPHRARRSRAAIGADEGDMEGHLQK